MNAGIRKSIMAVGIIASVAAIAGGIYMFYKRQISLALQYCYKIAGITIYHVRKDSINFQLILKVQNKSDFSLIINGYDLDVILNSKKIANVKSTMTTKILPATISEIPMELDFNPSEIFDKNYITELLTYMLADQTKIKLQIQGTMNITMNFIHLKKFKFDYSTTISEIVNAKPADNVKCDIV
jgi:LEA14-like dessication related protein